ncbi:MULTISPECIES: hypothetical protein [Pontibacillus]|uniref:Uncharacterized protein n=1 Tax=Pontibacillus salipaludis TaxID=1697394 RepID=A0ABQ1Q613_9BACI|nr:MULTISPECIES: hypothetical protein [Pontibacillus]QST00671.1 hypothetical protein IMZ31_03595 [Pontibacillus sp. ALD_SL1]GGD15613.1 hypothetical protein GCM10011389_24130 [Pontibacillus salipaludis]
MEETKLRKQAMVSLTGREQQFSKENNFLFNYGTLVLTSLALLVQHYFM